MADLNENVQQRTDDDLLKMVYEFELWSPEMLNAVEAELSKRGILPPDITERKVAAAELEDAQLSKGREAGAVGLLIGWLTVLGVIGIYMGYRYAFSKTAGKHNKKLYYVYDESSRKNGSYIFYISISLTIIAILYRIFEAIGVNR